MAESEDPYHWENLFYRTCNPSRIGKFVAHLKLYERILDVPGAIVECGVFKGNSLFRWAMFRTLFESTSGREIVAFDTFAKFPSASRPDDEEVLDRFLRDAGDLSLSQEEVQSALERKDCAANTELVAGDLVIGLPSYLERRPELEVALLHIDVDLFEPTKASLERLGPRLVSGGVCILDDYEFFPGATEAIDDYCEQHGHQLQRFAFARSPVYFVNQ